MINYSVVIPIYNAEKYLKECLDSIVIQIRDDIEVILVNDGSKDGSLKICKEYEKKYKNIKIIDKKNTGSMDSWMTGVKNSVGKYICFVDSDDKIEKEYFNTLDKYTTGNYDIILFDYYKYTPAQLIPMSNSKVNYGLCNDNSLKKIKHNYFSNYELITMYRWDKIIKADIIKNNINNVSFNAVYFEDIPISLKNFYDAQTIYHIDAKLYFYRIRKSSVSNSVNSKLFTDLTVVERETNNILKVCGYSDTALYYSKLYFDYQYCSNYLKYKEKIKNRRKISFRDIKKIKGKNKKLSLLLCKFNLKRFYSFLYRIKSKKTNFSYFE